MTTAWSRSGAKPSRSSPIKEEEDMESNGHMQVFMKPLDQGSYNIVLGWMGINNTNLSPRQVRWLRCTWAVVGTLLIYQLIVSDLGYAFHRACGLIVPLFSIVCAFYWLTFYFRKCWSTTSIYFLFCSCFAGEFLGQCVCDNNRDNYISQPILSFSVLLAVSVASIFSTLETVHSTAVIIFVSFLRVLSCTSLTDLPQFLRPYLAYFSGLVGVMAAKYMEALVKPVVSSMVTQEGKIPVIKRRRSSATAPNNFSTHRTGRRTSLPALINKSQAPSSSYESAIIGEAHGLISDMLADAALPPHIVSGLRAVSNLLKPPENHGVSHKPKVSPLVSLTEATNYGSDSEDLPYTGERPSSLPKRLRRSLPPSLIRRMSTSTWTTTTSATGMPTLEPEPCRTRSSSFRHSRESSPGSSPPASRSNSPSPSSPTTISLTIPKSRSFSASSASGATHTNTNNPPTSTTVGPVPSKRERSRKTTYYGGGSGATNGQVPAPKESPSPSSFQSPTKTDKPILSNKNDVEALDHLPSSGGKAGSGKDSQTETLSKRFNITSDYESNDSPSSSDHSDNVTGVDDGLSRLRGKAELGSYHQDSITEREEDELTDKDLEHNIQNKQSELSDEEGQQVEVILPRDSISVTKDKQHRETISSKDTEAKRSKLPFNPEENSKIDLLDNKRLCQWDYPIFELAAETQDTILSRVTYKLFMETGLFDTFRIPLPEFLNYFHALELGYRDKPYHNRIHATDVLHGCYYLTTQPIPGFQYVNPEGDVFQKHHTSDVDGERPSQRCSRPNFTADDTYGILGGNFPPLELMALYTAAAMHDYDHPGRTNAFLVATHAPLAVLYNDRSVLENHHAASAWRLFMAHNRYNWLSHLDKVEFKRFRFLVVEAILATDLKRHFEILAEFNAKVNDVDAGGVDWTSESDRLMVANMVIKMADINGPCKKRDLHFSWTEKISEEFYEQGDEEASLGLAISPYMDRKHPQLAKLQESFINHLVAPLCNAIGAAGVLPGTWVDVETESDETDTEKEVLSGSGDTEDEETDGEMGDQESKPPSQKIHCWLTKNLKDNHDMWVQVLKYEAAQKGRETTIADLRESRLSLVDQEMETIKEEDTPPNSAASTKDDSPPSAALDQHPVRHPIHLAQQQHQQQPTNTHHQLKPDPPTVVAPISPNQSESITADSSSYSKPADSKSNACTPLLQLSDSTDV